MTDRRKSITFPQTSFANGNEKKNHFNIGNVYILGSVTWPENFAASLSITSEGYLEPLKELSIKIGDQY